MITQVLLATVVTLLNTVTFKEPEKNLFAIIHVIDSRPGYG